MQRAIAQDSGQPRTLDLFDRVVMAYLVLPLPIFLLGWLRPWAALPLTLCVLYALRPLADSRPSHGAEHPVSRMQLTLAVLVGCAWTLLGGIGHFVFANYDWHIRDAVLHDLVLSPWPVGYGVFNGAESVLRAPLGYYLPAALVGKAFGLWTAHLAMGLWTATGATLFLLQVLSLTPRRTGVALVTVAVIVLFSGFDVLGGFLDNPQHFLNTWTIARHLEAWAGYQYSSLTTQLFWVPNHALGGWLTVGLLTRDSRGSRLAVMLPMIVVAVALWSPLTALGLVPFVLMSILRGSCADRLLPLMHPRVWGPAVLVGGVIGGYLVLDSSGLPFKLLLQGGVREVTLGLLRQLQFFLLEVGCIGFGVLALRWSWEVVLALVVLLVLPTFSFGVNNDLVMRASIPSLAVLAIGVCLALTQSSETVSSRKRLLLVCMLGIGAVTPIQEIARAILLPSWPVNMEATLIGAACGQHFPHYTARLNDQVLNRLLRPVHRIPLGPQGPLACRDPAFEMMTSWGLL